MSKNLKFGIILICLIVVGKISFAQQKTFTRVDSLRGSITPEREWWDLTYYHLDMSVDIENKSISGKNTIYYTVIRSNQRMQVDLQPPMKIVKVLQNGKLLEFDSETNAHFIKLNMQQKVGDQNVLVVYYSGEPREAPRPPWDGGITWSQDENGLPFVASTCQKKGASLWWPCKDHSYDEPDSMLISVNVPKNLVNVSNGRLRGIDKGRKGTKTFHWFVSNPINNYGVNINIGNYVNFSEKYEGEKGVLDLDYYVLKQNLKKAKEQFKQGKMTIEALEHWFGPYPFYEDSYKLVEAPYLGMEHQSSVTYGNDYKNGYRGTDLSSSGWGLKFDFIIVHESGHEWFANNITYTDVADMWIHEGFTAYSENLFLDYHYGKQAAQEYVIGTRLNINNDKPIIGSYGVNQRGGGDMYYKGANILHTLRQLSDDDEKWREILRGLNKEFYHQTVNTSQVENYIGKGLEMNLSSFFDQYLRDIRVPVLEYFVKDEVLSVKWINCVPGFDMPIKVAINGNDQWVNPNVSWKQVETAEPVKSVRLDPNFYVASMNVLGD